MSAAYNHAQYLKPRAEMMQWWADYLDELSLPKESSPGALDDVTAGIPPPEIRRGDEKPTFRENETLTDSQYFLHKKIT